MKYTQHAALNPKFDDGIIHISLVVAPKKIKGPTHVIESGHHLKNRPQPTPIPQEAGVWQ